MKNNDLKTFVTIGVKYYNISYSFFLQIVTAKNKNYFVNLSRL